MRKILLLLTLFVLAGTMMARQLTPDEALALAMGKMKAAQPKSSKAQAAGINAASVRLTHTEMTSQDVPLMYVYNIAKGGIIIASADDRVSSLLGYTDSGDFEGAKQNESFMAWLKGCSKALSSISSMPEHMRSASAGTRTLTTSVQPLLGEIKWNQYAPYNLLTPMRVGYPNGEARLDTIHAPTGCGATALAQLMMYYQWPVTGTGRHTNKNDSTQTIDFNQSTYQWSKMLPVYKGGESEESQMVVAQLMGDLGCALDMQYTYSWSKTHVNEILKALTDHFGYDKGMRLLYRNECSSEEWNRLLQTELNEQRPVLFGAVATSGGGHEFVIDGYDINGLYHVNWGWGGQDDGYFDMDIMDPYYRGVGGYDGGYTMGQNAILGVKPDMEGTSVAKPELVMTRHFLFDEKMQQWTYIVSNYGVGDFTGETGLALESPTGEISKLTSYKYNEEPIVCYQDSTYTFDLPDAPGPGYKLYPYYCDVIGGEMKRIPALYNSINILYSAEKDNSCYWTYDTDIIPDIEIDSVEVKHNFVGFIPQFNITLSNTTYTQKEFADVIAVDIHKEVDGEMKLVCTGYAQAFLNPGETKEFVLRCNSVEEEFSGKIVEGEYVYTLYIFLGGDYLPKRSEKFEMVVTPPSNITYSDFTINKTEFLPGEELTASMKVTNAGGFDMKNLAFAIFRASDYGNVQDINLRDVDIKADSSEAFTFKSTVSYAPGKYVATFFVNREQLDEAPVFKITVLDPTAIDKVVSTPANDSKSRIYDLQGRQVQQMRKGGMYITGKNKVVMVK